MVKTPGNDSAKSSPTSMSSARGGGNFSLSWPPDGAPRAGSLWRSGREGLLGHRLLLRMLLLRCLVLLLRFPLVGGAALKVGKIAHVLGGGAHAVRGADRGVGGAARANCDRAPLNLADHGPNSAETGRVRPQIGLRHLPNTNFFSVEEELGPEMGSQGSGVDEGWRFRRVFCGGADLGYGT